VHPRPGQRLKTLTFHVPFNLNSQITTLLRSNGNNLAAALLLTFGDIEGNHRNTVAPFYFLGSAR
jgi:hypothetical protein